MSENKGRLPESGLERLDAQLKFTAEIDKMTGVLRRTLLIDRSRRENDAEHSWHIAVMAMLFEEYAAEPVDTDRAVRMCLVHDLVEVYAGDTFAFDQAGHADKAERERAAADRLFSILPEDQARKIRTLWEEFDAMETADARYAACLDRLQPLVHNMLTGGHTWVEGKVDRSMIERRNEVLKAFMPRVYEWFTVCMDRAQQEGWTR